MGADGHQTQANPVRCTSNNSCIVQDGEVRFPEGAAGQGQTQEQSHLLGPEPDQLSKPRGRPAKRPGTI